MDALVPEAELRIAAGTAGTQSPVQGGVPHGGAATGGSSVYDVAYEATLFAGARVGAIALDLFASYRRHPQVANGQYDEYGYQRDAVTLGISGRYALFRMSRLEPWVSLGAGYAIDITGYTASASAQGYQHQTLHYAGIAFPVGIGADWGLSSTLAVGASLVVAPTVGVAASYDFDVTPKDSGPANAQDFVVATLGLHLRMSFPR